MGLHCIVTELLDIQKSSPYPKAYSDCIFLNLSIQNPEPGNSEIFGFIVKFILKIDFMFYF